MYNFDMERALDQLRFKASEYHLYENYDLGYHPTMFSSEQFRKFYAEVLRRYRLNLCRPVVDTVNERLAIDTWDGSAGITDWWFDRGIQLQNRLHRQTIRSGDGYILVWPEGTMDGEMRAHRILSTEATVVYTDEHEVPDYGIKLWSWEIARDKWKQRLNIYYKDRVERYIRHGTEYTNYGSGADFQWYDGDDAEPVIEYSGRLREMGQEGLLPIVHFSANPDLTPFGTSVLTDVLPVQDALNKHAIDLLVSSESLALPLRAILGFEVMEGVDGRPSNLPDYDPRIDYLLTIPGEASKLVQLPAADLTALVEAKQGAINDIASVAGIHPSRLKDTGQIPSGEALRVVERPLTSKVRNLQQDFTGPWTQVAMLLGFDGQPLWEDPVEMEAAEVWSLVQQKIDAGWPKRQAYIEAGIKEDEVDRILAENAELSATVEQNRDLGILL